MAIDRQKTVTRHNPVYEGFSLREPSPLSVGNGNLAFTADMTGLQSFADEYDAVFPLCTMCQWRVNTVDPDKYRPDDIKLKYYDFHGGKVGYATSKAGQEDCYRWLRENPHKYNIMRLGFEYGGKPLDANDISDARQELDLWSGVLDSSFKLKGTLVSVKTCCHQSEQAIGVWVESELLRNGSLTLRLRFPYSSPEKNGSDWTKDEAHGTEAVTSLSRPGAPVLCHTLDTDKYFVKIQGAAVSRMGRNDFELLAETGGSVFSACFDFTSAPSPSDAALTYEDAEASSITGLAAYWQEGGFVAINGSGADASKAFELERRVILSQYLTYIQCSGAYPPAETGLTVNSWYGKAHLEMHYWHAFHFMLFQKPRCMEASLRWYKNTLINARALAASQGFDGARWPKMIDNEGNGCPSPIAPLLIWQQPHVINYLHALYSHYADNGQPERARVVLEEYGELVFATADFMASYAKYDSAGERYVLGPAMIPAQENHRPEVALNPVFELEYWRYGLETAGKWAELSGVEANPRWAEVSEGLSKLPVIDGLYPAHENCPETYTKFNYDHPSFLCALGMLRGETVDREVMKSSLYKTLESWNRERLWGWDFPVLAMTASRLGLPELAVDCLLMDSPKNTYMPNGHNNQIPRADLPLYLPGNGGLLAAVAMMCRAPRGDKAADLHGFPSDWDVEFENINLCD